MDDIFTRIRTLGGTAEECPQGYAADFNNAIIGDPYLEGTGYFPDHETAAGVAAILIPMLDALARESLAADPDLGSCWTDPEGECASWAYIVSAERDEGDDPVIEEMFFGDDWFVAGASLPYTLSGPERLKFEKVKSALARVTPV